jgi:hypothetical protein
VALENQPAGPEGLKVEQVRVYYDPESGEVLHVHQLVSPPGEELESERVEDEMRVFEESLRQRYPDIRYLTMGEADLPKFGEGIRVDVEQGRLVAVEASI